MGQVPYGEMRQLYFRGRRAQAVITGIEKTFTEAVDSEGWALGGSR